MESQVIHVVEHAEQIPARACEVVQSESQDHLMQQRSHIAIIQMAPPAHAGAKISVTGQGPSGVKGRVGPRNGGPSRAVRTGGPRAERPPGNKKRHHCSVQGCPYNTPHTKDLARHMRKHTGEKPFTCDRCTKSFTRYDKLVMHIRIHEGHRPFSCQYCNYAATDSSSLRKHLRTHSQERPYKCQLCPYSSKDSSQLVVHLRHHTGDSPYVCSFQGCEAAFKTPSDLSRHIRLHTGEKPYKCLYCDYRAAVKCNLNVHMRRHTKDANASLRKTKSEIEIAPEMSELDSYQCTDEDHSELGNTSSSSALPFQYACKLCNYKGDTIGLFSIHMEDSHPDSNLRVRDLDDPSRVGRKCTKSKASQEHRRAFQCTTCNASFVREDSLRCHMRQHGTIPNRPANVAPEIYTPPNRIRVVHGNRANVVVEPPNNYTLHEMQRMPLMHSVITENRSVIAATSCASSSQHDNATPPMYLVNFENEDERDHNQIESNIYQEQDSLM